MINEQNYIQKANINRLNSPYAYRLSPNLTRVQKLKLGLGWIGPHINAVQFVYPLERRRFEKNSQRLYTGK